MGGVDYPRTFQEFDTATPAKAAGTAVSLAGSPSRQQAGGECLGIGQLHEVAHLQIGHSLLHLRVLDADRVGIPFGTPQSDRVIDEIDGGDFGHHGELLAQARPSGCPGCVLATSSVLPSAAEPGGSTLADTDWSSPITTLSPAVTRFRLTSVGTCTVIA